MQLYFIKYILFVNKKEHVFQHVLDKFKVFEGVVDAVIVN